MAGRGVVIDQDLAPGSPVLPGTTIRLTLRSPTVLTAAVVAKPASAATRKPAAADRASLRVPSAGFAGATESEGEAAERAEGARSVGRGAGPPSELSEDAER